MNIYFEPSSRPLSPSQVNTAPSVNSKQQNASTLKSLSQKEEGSQKDDYCLLKIMKAFGNLISKFFRYLENLFDCEETTPTTEAPKPKPEDFCMVAKHAIYSRGATKHFQAFGDLTGKKAAMIVKVGGKVVAMHCEKLPNRLHILKFNKIVYQQAEKNIQKEELASDTKVQVEVRILGNEKPEMLNSQWVSLTCGPSLYSPREDKQHAKEIWKDDFLSSIQTSAASFCNSDKCKENEKYKDQLVQFWLY